MAALGHGKAHLGTGVTPPCRNTTLLVLLVILVIVPRALLSQASGTAATQIPGSLHHPPVQQQQLAHTVLGGKPAPLGHAG